MNRYMVILMAGVVGFTLASSSAGFAMSCGSDKGGSEATCDHATCSKMAECNQQAAAAPSAAIDAGNKICPVTGEKIDEASKITYEYEGKIYNFCCPGCIEPFKKEPQKYIDKVNQELQSDQGVK